MAFAIGWVDLLSTIDTSSRSLILSTFAPYVSRLVTTSSLRVSVPVLSNAIISTSLNASMVDEPLIKMPFFEAYPTPQK